MGLKIKKNTIDAGLLRKRRLLFNNGRKVLSAGARVIRIKAARGTPIDTSRLVNSIRAEDGGSVFATTPSRLAFKNTPSRSDVINRFRRVSRDRNQLVFGSGVPYAEAVEYGTSRQAPQPFFRSALQSGAKQALGAMGTVMFKEVINK